MLMEKLLKRKCCNLSKNVDKYQKELYIMNVTDTKQLFLKLGKENKR